MHVTDGLPITAELKELYLACKPKFLGMAKTSALSRADLLDVYQDAMVALLEMEQKNKLATVKTTLDTYLLAIAKYMLYKRQKAAQLIVAEMPDLLGEWDDFEHYNNDDNVWLLRNAFEKLGQQCKRLLQLFYYEQKKLDDIVQIMKYENKNAAKSQKYKCVQQLKNSTNHARK
ncbi:MAG: sigma-70 family RNA polymerase sigma factor [Bacteroidetes bacterium]|nr:MAG: sigma-70 family RNA polymerase sigma factor [Bacteroidota bacterium]